MRRGQCADLVPVVRLDVWGEGELLRSARFQEVGKLLTGAAYDTAARKQPSLLSRQNVLDIISEGGSAG